MVLALLGGLGGATGTLAGLAAVTAYALYQGWPVVLPAGADGGGLGGAVVVGVVAGLHPAMRAARLPPIEALQSP